MSPQLHETGRKGYPKWAWGIAILTFWPLPGMLAGRFFPKTRRFLGAPGVILSAVLLLAIPVTIGLVIPQPEESSTNSSQLEQITIQSPISATLAPKQAATSKPSGQSVPTQGILAVNPIIDRISPNGIRKGSLKGWVLNFYGEECWFGQAATDDNSVSYFYKSLTGSDTLLVFDDQACMTDPMSIGMAFHQRTVNQAISSWYSKPDAKFMVTPDKLYRKSQLQVKGWCIQSTTYPSTAIAVDYFVDGESLVAVVHNYAVGGCEN